MDKIAIMRRVIELSRRGMRGVSAAPTAPDRQDGEIVGEGHNGCWRPTIRPPTPKSSPFGASAKLKSFNLSGCDVCQRNALLHVHGKRILWARISKRLLRTQPEASSEIGLGDEHLYAEMARPLGERRIVPMVNFPDLDKEATAVYRECSQSLVACSIEHSSPAFRRPGR
jgi:hypothetical protein